MRLRRSSAHVANHERSRLPPPLRSGGPVASSHLDGLLLRFDQKSTHRKMALLSQTPGGGGGGVWVCGCVVVVVVVVVVDFSSAWWAAITAALGELMEHGLRSQDKDRCFLWSQC